MENGGCPAASTDKNNESSAGQNPQRRESLNSQDRVSQGDLSSAINAGGTSSGGALGGAPSTIQTVKMKASEHINDGGSTIEVGQSGSMILVQDPSAASAAA